MSNEKNASQLFPTVVVIILVIMAFGMGVMWQKLNQYQTGGSLAGVGTNQPTPAQPAPGEVAVEAGEVEPVSKDDFVKGKRDARIALIEYSDLECPFCQQFHATAQKLVDDYDGKLMWVYRHYPLSFHPQAEPRAIGAECAAKIGGQDKFWEYADYIFSQASFTGTPTDAATKVGIDKGKFEECIKDPKMKENVTNDFNSGNKAGVTGTPGNIILDTKTGNKKLIPGALPAEQLKPIIDEMLNS